MLRAERLKLIKECIDRHGFITINELSKEFEISEATIRRDIAILDEDGIVKKVPGGVMSANLDLTMEPSLRARSAMNVKEKERIAKAARKYINDGDHIILDAGTTVYTLARLLDDAKDLTVITYDMHTAMELAHYPGVNLILAGGVLRKNFDSFYGSITESIFAGIHAKRAFLSCDALCPETGIMSYTCDDINVKRQIIKSSDELILLCDHSKIGIKVFMSIAPVDVVTRIITGYEASPEIVQQLRDRGIEVEVV